jgi:predicted phage baseplate assembly protein
MPPPQTLDERLPTPKLDDRRFQDLVDEAKRRVQQQCPEWTDHNVSDPGVTLIETFAWMTDQLLYRLNRVPDLNYVKFLELLGVTLFPPTAAKADLTFRLSKSQPTTLTIPAETQVSTPRTGSGEQITFATSRILPIVPCSRQALASVDPFGVARSHDDGERVECFGDHPLPGDAFLVGLSGPVPSCTVRLYLPCTEGAGGGIAPDNPPIVWDARVGDDEGTVSLWNPRTSEELGGFTTYGGHAVRCVAFGGDGHKVAAGGEGAVWLRDVHEPGRPGHRFDGHAGAVLALAFSPDGSSLASAGADGTIWLWDLHGHEYGGRRLDAHEGSVLSVAFDPTGQKLVSAGVDGTVRLWDVEKPEAVERWDVHERSEPPGPSETGGGASIVGATFRQGGQQVAAVGDDGTLWLFGVGEPEHEGLERPLGGNGGSVHGVAFSPDGRLLATAGDDETARIWDLDPEATDADEGGVGLVHVLTGHQGRVYAMAFSPDGKTLATVGADWTARLWDVAAGAQLRRPLSDRCPLGAVAFHPKGDMVATAGLDGGWERCEVEIDETKGLNAAAQVVLHVPPNHRSSQVGDTNAGWLRCRVRAVEHGQLPYDKSPEIEGDVLAETIGGTVEALNVEIVDWEALGLSEGVAGQRFPLERRPVVPLPGNEKHVLLVGEGAGPDEWREVTSFAEVGEDERCFALDYVAGAVAFGPTVRQKGDNGTDTYRQYGAVPPKGALMRLKRYMSGGGKRGNVAEHKLTVLRSPIANVASVENRRPASGGVDGEELENAKLRGPITLRTANRAVTPEDFEQLAREAAPELARVECIPADEDHGGEARVLVIPNVETDDRELRFEQLMPSVETINRIRAYLDRRRVIGVRVLVSPPRYHAVTVAARLVARTEYAPGDVKERALDALYEVFSPITGGRAGEGWEFGRAVREGDVYAVLQSVPGVDRVDDCRLFEANPLTGQRTPLAPPTDGRNGRPHRIEVPVSRYATVFSFRHYVTVVEH